MFIIKVSIIHNIFKTNSMRGWELHDTLHYYIFEHNTGC